ncbi:hypothetical protein [Psychrobacter pacificensis]|uniref:hypothetical protein n=1 Tax=Psychrobacter pacificensis TaxID=112002 RepID=UPI003D06935F
MTKDNRNDLKADHGQHSDNQPHKRSLLLRFIIFMAWVIGIGLLLSLVACSQATVKPIATDDNSGYYIDLSKLTSGQASRDILAFFVPDNSAASQAVSIRSSTALQAYSSATRGQTIISKVTTSPTDYDGLTLQNKIAERRICRAVSSKTESKTRHPIPLPYSVTLTHNLLGGHNHA